MKILMLCSYDSSLIDFRGDLIKDLIANGHTVFAAAPSMDSGVSKNLQKMGAKPVSYELERTGINPLKDIKSVFQLKGIIKKLAVDLVFPYTIKPVIYGSLAASMNGTPAVSLITGLGLAFSGTSTKAAWLHTITKLLYRISIRRNKMVIFQNKEDQRLFKDLGITTPGQRTEVVNGSGVNLDQYVFRENKKKTSNVKFILVARLIHEKGIGLYIEAAKRLKSVFPKAEFHIIGAPDRSPSAIKPEKLKAAHENGTIVNHGPQDGVARFLDKMDVFVLPSFYREGVPRSILEALAVGLPIITTDTPGCRETIEKGENGILIKPQHCDELESAMRFFLENPHKIKDMGNNSHNLAKEKFDVKIINQKLISYIHGLF